jgi:hypothetical protein
MCCKIFRLVIFVFFIVVTNFYSQSFMLQGWYWDYPKDGCNGYSGSNWAAALNTKVTDISNAGFDFVWLPPLSRASFGQCSNGYDPKDLYDLGEYGLGRTGFGTRTEVDQLINTLSNSSINSVADVVYNHRDGGDAEENTSVEGWIENFTSTKVNNGDNAFPSDRFRCVLPIGGATGLGTGTYYFKIKSASGHSNYYGKKYKVYMWTNTVGWQNQTDVDEVEPNGGGDCGEGNNAITLGRNYWAFVDNAGCGVDEFALTIGASDYNSAGDNIYIALTNDGSYSDHFIYGIYYTGTSSDVQSNLKYQTYTDFTNMPSGQGSMTYMNFKPNGNPTQLSGDWDWMYFYYDYDQTVAATKTALFDWTKWLWNSVGLRGFRMDAVKHFTPEFVGDLLDDLHDNSINPQMVVGEFYDANSGSLKNWIDQVYTYMDADTKASISPRIFDFSLRDALKSACDGFGYDVRNVFNASLVDAQSISGFNVVTFANNHDFRDAGQYIENDHILAYAYILTNNQIGIPCVYYPDFFTISGYPTTGKKSEIETLMSIHKDYIVGATSRDYLTRTGTPYSPFYNSGLESTTLVYQLMGTNTGNDVIVAINFAGDPLDMWVGINGSGLSSGNTLGDRVGNATSSTLTVTGDSRVNIQLPARSYAVWVENATPVPVELVSFTAEKMSDDILLKWQTATEINNYGFEIERCNDFSELNFEDPQPQSNDWQSIAFVQGNGNSNSPKFYEYTDELAPTGNLKYRLKQIDTDGNFEYYSTIVEVPNGITSVDENIIPTKYMLSQNFPNPFNPSTTIKFQIARAGFIKIIIYDIMGEIVEIITDSFYEAGEYSINWDPNNLSSGIYFYSLVSTEFTVSKKMLFLK